MNFFSQYKSISFLFFDKLFHSLKPNIIFFFRKLSSRMFAVQTQGHLQCLLGHSLRVLWYRLHLQQLRPMCEEHSLTETILPIEAVRLPECRPNRLGLRIVRRWLRVVPRRIVELHFSKDQLPEMFLRILLSIQLDSWQNCLWTDQAVSWWPVLSHGRLDQLHSDLPDMSPSQLSDLLCPWPRYCRFLVHSVQTRIYAFEAGWLCHPLRGWHESHWTLHQLHLRLREHQRLLLTLSK